jgi:hypothetical protein
MGTKKTYGAYTRVKFLWDPLRRATILYMTLLGISVMDCADNMSFERYKIVLFRKELKRVIGESEGIDSIATFLWTIN